jgi:hypothetical protein
MAMHIDPGSREFRASPGQNARIRFLVATCICANT